VISTADEGSADLLQGRTVAAAWELEMSLNNLVVELVDPYLHTQN
jgi:hypothetical protein